MFGVAYRFATASCPQYTIGIPVCPLVEAPVDSNTAMPHYAGERRIRSRPKSPVAARPYFAAAGMPCSPRTNRPGITPVGTPLLMVCCPATKVAT
jgi:hypothetical protein